MAPESFQSTDDQRTKNNSARMTYRTLTDEEKALIDYVKRLAEDLEEAISRTPGRESSVALTNLQTATMWAVRAITA